jgi:molybdopterin molybdotransferase
MSDLPRLADIVSCLADYDPGALPVARAQQVIERLVVPIDCVERVAIRASFERVLARDVDSPIDVPAHDNSAMDGWAVRAEDLVTDRETELFAVGTAYAGVAFPGRVEPGRAVRVMTGAVMPEGTDTVVVQEVVRVDGDRVWIPAGQQRGQNRRLRGEDLRAGRPALHAGRRLGPADLGLLASLGVAEVPVQRRLRVAFFSTGDELRSIGQPLDPGCVYDSNRYTLHGMLTRLGVELIDMGVVRDDPAALEAAFRTAAENADAIITSGGVSVGEADFTKQMMAQLGDVTFWKIAMRPGRPMAFGRIASNGRSAFLFGLPGNPVAVMVTFYHFVRGALLRMMGATETGAPLVPAISVAPIRKRPGRTEYQRGIATLNGSGQLEVRLTGQQGSGVLRSMSEANCFVVLAHEQAQVNAGDAVQILLFDGLV